MNAPATRRLLGGHAPAAFLRRYWQRHALLVRHALPDFSGLHTRADLIALACRDDVESRLVTRERGRWTLAEGPFRPGDFRRLPARDWTLLVQGVNLADAPTDALLRRFAFIPYARLDDVMVSYAAPGGGVGPHFDSYDVFLLQGFGRRRWRYGPQTDLTLVPALPLKILRHFTPAAEAVLASGDLLYLPPRHAHDGVAVEACTTYSIGFRAAAYEELAQHFLDFLRDRVELSGRYTDPGLKPTRAPARIDSRMARTIGAAFQRVRWRPQDVARFTGAFLSEPKGIVRFARPVPRRSAAAFAAAIARHGLALDRGAQLLYDDETFYLNGEVVPPPSAGAATLRRLANRRALSAQECARIPAALAARLHEWHDHGYLAIDR